MKKVGIIGGSGYTGGELIRLVLNHPALELDFVYSTTRANTEICDTHQDLIGQTKLAFTGKVNPKVAIVFLCLGHGNSSTFLAENTFDEATLIIDLSNDFRLHKESKFQGQQL